jgi:hypothetical protein
MSGAERLQRRLRAQAEHHLRLAAMEELRADHPGTTPPGHERSGAFWRLAFIPAYRKVPWETKQRAMKALGMTAESHGWKAPDRRPREPWRPPPVQR